jgi:signal transduction histidine kinase
MDDRIPVHFEQYFRSEDAERWFHFQVHPNPGEGLIVYVRDTTETRRTEQALLRSEQLAAAGRLAASIAHEINNPLEAVTNLLYLVRMDESLSDPSKDLLDVADRELQRLSHITARSLKFYRQRTAPGLTLLDELIESVLFFHETEIKLRSIQVRRRYRPSPPVLCFSGEIQQVLTNLISNALEAIPEKGCMYLRVSPNSDRGGRNGLAVTVADSGTGMDRFTIDRLFHPFVTTKGEAGTGLGLWVSKGILDKHHGTIRVRSKKNLGTVFRIFLPLDTTIEHSSAEVPGGNARK